MSVTLSTIGGSLAVEMPDHRARVHRYRVEVLANTPERFSVRLVKLDGKDAGTAYLVQIGPRWHACDCPWYRFKARKLGELCKHLEKMHVLRDVLAVMAGVMTKQTTDGANS